MSDEEFDEWLSCLHTAETWLQAAFEVMDSIEGYSSIAENAHVAAVSAIRAVRTVETACRNCPSSI